MAGRLRRHAPPVVLFAGLFLFGVSLLVLGTQATEEGPRELDPSSLTTENGTALLVYPAPYYGQYSERVVVDFAFPEMAGDAYFVGCDDLARLRAGAAPESPLLAFTGVREGSFVASRQTVPERGVFYVERPSVHSESNVTRYCAPAVAFQWPATDGEAGANRPTTNVTYHSAKLDAESFAFLAILMGGSALLALLGGLAWARARGAAPHPLPSDDSTLETLRASIDRMGEQLERTRKHLLLAGVLGVFLWYPFLVPWAWQQAARSSDHPVAPWGVAALTLAFLGVLTVLWAREFLGLDRELNTWRRRMRELRDRETTLLDTLELHGR